MRVSGFKINFSWGLIAGIGVRERRQRRPRPLSGESAPTAQSSRRHGAVSSASSLHEGAEAMLRRAGCRHVTEINRSWVRGRRGIRQGWASERRCGHCLLSQSQRRHRCGCAWPGFLAVRFSEGIFHTRAVPSWLAVTMQRPSWLYPALLTLSVWLLSSASSSPLSASHASHTPPFHRR